VAATLRSLFIITVPHRHRRNHRNTIGSFATAPGISRARFRPDVERLVIGTLRAAFREDQDASDRDLISARHRNSASLIWMVDAHLVRTLDPLIRRRLLFSTLARLMQRFDDSAIVGGVFG